MCSGNRSSLGESNSYDSNSIDQSKNMAHSSSDDDVSRPTSGNEDIEENLYKHNEFFKKMIDLVPAHFYFDAETREKLEKTANAEEGRVFVEWSHKEV